MSPIVRGWLAFAALGAGLIHLALVMGAPVALAVAFGLLGFTEFAWGVVTFVREPFAPRAAIAVAIVPTVAWVGLVAVTASGGMRELAASIDVLPPGVATLFELFIAAALGAHVRRDAARTPRTPATARYLLGLAAGAIVVAGLTAVALAAAQSGLGGTVVDLDLPEHGTDPGH